MVATTRVLIPAPVHTPAPFGLFSAAALLPMPDRALLGGVQFETVGCGSSRSLGITSCGATGTKDLPVGGPDVVYGDPFIIYDSFNCGPREDARQIAAQRLAIGGGCAAEQALQTGLAGPVNLATAQVVSDKAVDQVDALTVLTAAMAAGGCVAGGIIHAPRAAAIELASAGLVTRDGNVLRDPLGNAYAFGCCYTSAGPPFAPVPDGTRYWMWASGPVTVYRDPTPIMSPPAGVAFNTATNDMTVLAEQPTIIAVECGVWAVPVCADACVDLAGPISTPVVALQPSTDPQTVPIHGAGFTADTVVYVNGATVASTFVSSTELQITITASPTYTPDPGFVQIAVSGVCPGTLSPAVTVPITPPHLSTTRRSHKKKATPRPATEEG